MEVLTREKGKVDVAAENLLTIPEGLFGFEMYSKYALIDSEYMPFIWLQSCEDSNLAFLIVDPFRICADYEADIDDETLSKIGIEKPEDIIIMAIVTVPRNGAPITANLQGPLVINKKNQKCMQVVLNDNRWSTKFDIMKALEQKGER
ncbi:flagellar assembly protein FliW [Treponema sp. C6A8]|uniref:flagellar assembly protein FliW n=1 Tax=Treponema sp. C6A8 TaxID=1410609 RepID=UPI000489A003|nr:flagellar assembly protein FliW [Treponema sp. C6A8]